MKSKSSSLHCLLASISIFASLNSSARADNLTPTSNDFAYGCELNNAANNSLQRFEVEEQIYRAASSSNLYDLRVFDASDSILPHEFSQPETMTSRTQVINKINFFPIQEAKEELGNSSQLEIQESTENGTLSFHYKGKGNNTSPGKNSYLVDLRKIKETISSLEFEWTSSNKTAVVQATIESSDDLKTWSPIISNAALLKLSYESDLLDQKNIALPRTNQKFIKITLTSSASVSLTNLNATFETVKINSPERKEFKVEGKAEENNNTNFTFDTKGSFPISSVRIALPNYSMIRYSLFSRHAINQQWTLRLNSRAYRLMADGIEVTSPSNNTIDSNDQFWLLSIENKDSNFGSKTPSIYFGYTPDQITFLASGNPPYKVAYGNAQVKKPDFDFSMIRKALPTTSELTIPLVKCGPQISLGGPEKLIKIATPEPDRRNKAVLWIVLVAVIGLVGSMAYHLFRDLRKS